MPFVDLELGRKWADYDNNEPLPEILFGIRVEPNAQIQDQGWQSVKTKPRKKPLKIPIFEAPRRTPCINQSPYGA